MRPTLRLGRVAGIAIGVHWSLLVIGGLLVSALAGGLLPSLQPDTGGSYWAAAILAVVLFFGSILAHELAHSLVAIRRGQRVEGITLWLLGGVAQLKDEAKDARSELYVALAGPATSLALGAGFVGLAIGLDRVLPAGSLLPTVALWLGVVNVVLGVFNMLPGAPLDGGRVLAALVWAWRKDRRRAQIVAARSGRVVGWLLVALPLVAYVTGSPFGSIWTVLVGWFVVDASRREEEQARIAQAVDDRTVAELMAPLPPAVPEWTPAARLPELTGEPVPEIVVVADFGGTPRGLVDTSALAGAPEGTLLRDVAVPLATLAAAPPSTPGRDALALGLPLVVVDDGRIVGIVGVAQVRAGHGPATRRS